MSRLFSLKSRTQMLSLGLFTAVSLALSLNNGLLAATTPADGAKVKSVVFPIVLQALNDIVHGPTAGDKNVALQEDPTKAISGRVAQLIGKSNISKAYLAKVLNKLNTVNKANGGINPHAFLPADDEADVMIRSASLLDSLKSMPWQNGQAQFPAPAPEIEQGKWPKMALHAFKVDVINPDDDWGGDDIYCYFFITDGVIPTGKATGIYKGVSAGQSFFLNETDRAVYPVLGIRSATPSNHLIVDYGLVESDGDDIKNMQKITNIIIDIALTVYNTVNPSTSILVENLRKEVKNLADALLALNSDDRLVTDTVYFKGNDMMTLFGDQSYFEFEKLHEGTHGLSTWSYNLHFRALKDL